MQVGPERVELVARHGLLVRPEVVRLVRAQHERLGLDHCLLDLVQERGVGEARLHVVVRGLPLQRARRRRLRHGLADPGAGGVLGGQLIAHVLGLGIEQALHGVHGSARTGVVVLPHTTRYDR